MWKVGCGVNAVKMSDGWIPVWVLDGIWFWPEVVDLT